jgi:hypothetical protein
VNNSICYFLLPPSHHTPCAPVPLACARRTKHTQAGAMHCKSSLHTGSPSDGRHPERQAPCVKVLQQRRRTHRGCGAFLACRAQGHAHASRRSIPGRRCKFTVSTSWQGRVNSISWTTLRKVTASVRRHSAQSTENSDRWRAAFAKFFQTRRTVKHLHPFGVMKHTPFYRYNYRLKM